MDIGFIIYGYYEDKTPHICSLLNPGVIINHDLERCAVIGTGTHMARASISRKPLSPYRKPLALPFLPDNPWVGPNVTIE